MEDNLDSKTFNEYLEQIKKIEDRKKRKEEYNKMKWYGKLFYDLIHLPFDLIDGIFPILQEGLKLIIILGLPLYILYKIMSWLI